MKKRISELTNEERTAWEIKKRNRNIKARLAVIGSAALVATFSNNKPILILMLAIAFIFLIWTIYTAFSERLHGIEIDSLELERTQASQDDNVTPR